MPAVVVAGKIHDKQFYKGVQQWALFLCRFLKRLIVKYYLYQNQLSMHSEQISKFIEDKHLSTNPVKIEFKTRSTIIGLFIQTTDYNELKAKNFWRIVSEAKIKDWKNSNDNSLARISNGQEITRLSAVK